MCNLYRITTNQAAIAAMARAMRDASGNLPPSMNVYPDLEAPIVRIGADGVRELVRSSWGMPTSQFVLMQGAKKKAEALKKKGQEPDFKNLMRMERDPGVTNIRNLDSKHWKRWMGLEHRCVVPFTSFSEFNKAAGGNIWFALDASEPLVFFVGVHLVQHTSVRKVKDGEVTKDLFAFLITEPNAEVGAIHPKAMPVILRTADEVEQWLSAPAGDISKLQQPLHDGSLTIVARGREDGRPQ